MGYWGQFTYLPGPKVEFGKLSRVAPVQQLPGVLDRTHIYVGIATVAIIPLHIALMDVPMKILSLPAVLILVVWQGLFGMFLSWRYSPAELKKFAYLVHAQFATGIMIGIFAYFGHILID